MFTFIAQNWFQAVHEFYSSLQTFVEPTTQVYKNSVNFSALLKFFCIIWQFLVEPLHLIRTVLRFRWVQKEAFLPSICTRKALQMKQPKNPQWFNLIWIKNCQPFKLLFWIQLHKFSASEEVVVQILQLRLNTIMWLMYPL